MGRKGAMGHVQGANQGILRRRRSLRSPSALTVIDRHR